MRSNMLTFSQCLSSEGWVHLCTAEMSVTSIKAITRIEIWSNSSAEKSWSLKE